MQSRPERYRGLEASTVLALCHHGKEEIIAITESVDSGKSICIATVTPLNDCFWTIKYANE